MPQDEDQLLIMRSGTQYGPYPRSSCGEMLMRQQLLPSDLAWRPGMAEWRPLGELVQFAQAAAPQFSAPISRVPADDDDDTVAGLIGQMGCGCLVWIGLLLLAIGG